MFQESDGMAPQMEVPTNITAESRIGLSPVNVR